MSRSFSATDGIESVSENTEKSARRGGGVARGHALVGKGIRRRTLTPVPSYVGFILVLAIPLLLSSDYYFSLGMFIALYAINCVGLTLLYGFAGQISVAQAAFYGLGAYVAAAVTLDHHLPSLVAVGLAAAVPAVVAYPLGRVMLRLSELYLAVATLAVAEIFGVLLTNMTSLTGGALGRAGIPAFAIGHLKFTSGRMTYVVAAATLLVVVWLARGVEASAVGRALHAIRTSTDSASVFGIPAASYKTRTLVLSAAMSGLAGGVYAQLVSYISPDTFSTNLAILLLVMIFLGGLRSIWGAIVGAAVFTILPHIFSGYANSQALFTGIVLVLVMLFFPLGIVGGVGTLYAMGTRLVCTRLRHAVPTTGNTDHAASYPAEESHLRPLATDLLTPGRRDETGPAIELEDVEKSFGGLTVLRGVSFKVDRGSIVGLIGTNGAGKTTCFNIVSGLVRPDSGSVRLAGNDVTKLSPDRRAVFGVGRTFQDLRLFGDQTVLNNVLVGTHRFTRAGFVSAALHLPWVQKDERTSRRRAMEALDVVGIPHIAESTVSQLPFAQQRLVDLARALASSPSLLLLDEAASGLSVRETMELRRLVRSIADRGVAVLLVEHNMELVMGLAEEVILLSGGSIVFRGKPREALNDATVRSAYLGTQRTRAPETAT